jgi:hypothetical protein
MSAVESYREWQGRRDRMLPSGGISRSHRGPDEVWLLGERCSTRTHYINFAGQLLGAAVPPLAAIPNDSRAIASRRDPSKRRISGLSAQATSGLRIEGALKCSRIVRGSGCGRGMASVAEPISETPARGNRKPIPTWFASSQIARAHALLVHPVKLGSVIVAVAQGQLYCGLSSALKVCRARSELLVCLAPEFDEAAMNAVKNWKFSPATKDGKPVAVQINVRVNFHLSATSDSGPKTPN